MTINNELHLDGDLLYVIFQDGGRRDKVIIKIK